MGLINLNFQISIPIWSDIRLTQGGHIFHAWLFQFQSDLILEGLRYHSIPTGIISIPIWSDIRFFIK